MIVMMAPAIPAWVSLTLWGVSLVAAVAVLWHLPARIRRVGVATGLALLMAAAAAWAFPTPDPCASCTGWICYLIGCW